MFNASREEYLDTPVQDVEWFFEIDNASHGAEADQVKRARES